MAVHIIGEPQEGTSKALLPEPDIRLPGPETAEPVRRLFGINQLVELIGHSDPLVRGYAVERASREPNQKALHPALISRLQDEDLFVFMSAVSLLANQRVEAAADSIGALFQEQQGVRAGQLGHALGRIAPPALLHRLQQKGRLDDETYAYITSTIATTSGKEEILYLKKAMRRVGLLKPERIISLFSAVLISGEPTLCYEVLGQAIAQSNVEAPDGSYYPGRVAVGRLAGIPPEYTLHMHGEILFEQAQKVLEEDILPSLDEDQAKTLTEAISQKAVGDILRTLAPLTELTWSDAAPEHTQDVELKTLAERRKGLLTAIVRRARDLERLDLQASAVFVVAAAQAASILAAWALPESTSAAATALAKAFGTDSTELLSLNTTELSKRFETQSAREMRRFNSIVVREPFRRASTLQTFAEAITRAGYGAGLLSALGEAEDQRLQDIVIKGIVSAPEDAETAILEILDETELDEKAIHTGLRCVEELCTERLALAIGRRFFELRRINKALTARSLLFCADQRVLPILESRAFANEPEEGAWVLLSLIHGREMDSALSEALARVKSLRDADESEVVLEVELQCKQCHETGVYSFEKAFVDPEKSAEWGDPAFVGDPICKACGAEDQLTPTPQGGQGIAMHMVHALRMMRSGNHAPTLVSPNQTTIDGKKMGLADALRIANKRVEESPQGIRPRLERAQLRLVLKRSGLEEDLAAIWEQDSESVEAGIIEASNKARLGMTDEAVTQFSSIHSRLVTDGKNIRLYNAESHTSLQKSIEDLLLSMEQSGTQIPAHVNLDSAKRRKEELSAALQEYLKKQEATPN